MKDQPSSKSSPSTAAAASHYQFPHRFYAQLTDCDPATVTFEMPVELTFRRIHEGEDYVNYFWKLRPASIPSA